jgi:NDP-sugar pyrophosphorylase family protein
MKKSGKKVMQAIILTGGKGTRLRPLTLTTPKPVVPLANRPFLAYQLEMIRRAGIRDVVPSLSYLQAHRDLLGGLQRIFRGYRKKNPSLWAAPGVQTPSTLKVSGRAMLGPESRLGEGIHPSGTAVIGKNCRVGDRVNLDNCVLWEGVEIGEGSRLKGCVLAGGVQVGAHSHLSGHAVLGEQSVLPPYSRLSGGDAGNPA